MESMELINGCNNLWVKNCQTSAALCVGALTCSKRKSREHKAAGRTRFMPFSRPSITPL